MPPYRLLPRRSVPHQPSGNSCHTDPVRQATIAHPIVPSVPPRTQTSLSPSSSISTMLTPMPHEVAITCTTLSPSCPHPQRLPRTSRSPASQRFLASSQNAISASVQHSVSGEKSYGFSTHG